MLRRKIGAVALLILVADQGWASDLSNAIDGLWEGPTFKLAVAAHLGIASTNPEILEDWRPFHVLDTQGSMIFFSVGKERYVGLLNGTSLSLTRVGDTNAFLLRRRSLAEQQPYPVKPESHPRQ